MLAMSMTTMITWRYMHKIVMNTRSMTMQRRMSMVAMTTGKRYMQKVVMNTMSMQRIMSITVMIMGNYMNMNAMDMKNHMNMNAMSTQKQERKDMRRYQIAVAGNYRISLIVVQNLLQRQMKNI